MKTVNVPELQQTLFNKAYLGLKSQGFKRADGYNINGKCAIGWLLPNDFPFELYEGSRVDREIAGAIPEVDDFFKTQPSEFVEKKFIDFLVDLQDYHDSSWGPTEMEGDMKYFAESWGLVIPK